MTPSTGPATNETAALRPTTLALGPIGQTERLVVSELTGPHDAAVRVDGTADDVIVELSQP